MTMKYLFFSRSIDYVIAAALLGILLWASIQLYPVAVERWF
jgi:hypothetical protein